MERQNTLRSIKQYSDPCNKTGLYFAVHMYKSFDPTWFRILNEGKSVQAMLKKLLMHN